MACILNDSISLLQCMKLYIVTCNIHCVCIYRYRERYWRESVFTGVEGIKESLASAYGSDEVSVANAAMRWMVHHSQLDARCGGSIQRSK